MAALGLAVASCAHGAVVTWTLSLNENAAGQCQAKEFALYTSVSKEGNGGLFGFLIDLNAADDGGANLTALTNRSPAGRWDADPADSDYDPDVVYPTKFGGFTAVRSATLSKGIVSGHQEIVKGPDLVAIGAMGQTPGNMSAIHPPPAINPDDSSNPGTAVSYATYLPEANSDVAYGTSAGILPGGSLRLATGAWSGTVAPSFNPFSLDNKALVWNSALTREEGFPRIIFRTTDRCAPRPLAGVSLTNARPAGNSNEAFGNSILVNGSSGQYSSEVDDLSYYQSDPASAPVASIGDEEGGIYVMAKLVGDEADIAAILALTTQDVDSSDEQYALLHEHYDARFGLGGFNALFRFPNIAGAKVFNWDFGYPVIIEQLAVVPEPNCALATGLACITLLRRSCRRPHKRERHHEKHRDLHGVGHGQFVRAGGDGHLYAVAE